MTSEDTARAEATKMASDRLAASDSIITARRLEADTSLVGDVTQHAALYQQSLMGMLWNETYYSWDGTSGVNPEFDGRVNAHDVLILPDKWEYPYPSSWEMAFNAISAGLISETLAQDQLLFVLSDRWQQPDGHIPCSEADMSDECPPVFAWAAWRVYEQSHDLEFLQAVYPSLQRNYDYWWSHNMIGNSLFSGGALGMDNLPRSDMRVRRPTRVAGWRFSRAIWRASRPSCAIHRGRSVTGLTEARSRKRSTRIYGTSRPASITTSTPMAHSSPISRTAVWCPYRRCGSARARATCARRAARHEAVPVACRRPLVVRGFAPSTSLPRRARASTRTGAGRSGCPSTTCSSKP